MGEFKCFTSSIEVTYRASINGNSSTSSSEILRYLEEWISSGTASILVQGLRLDLDSSCLPIVIDSFSDPECMEEESNETGSDNTITIVGGVGGILAVATIVTIVFLLVRKKRKHAVQKGEK